MPVLKFISLCVVAFAVVVALVQPGAHTHVALGDLVSAFVEVLGALAAARRRLSPR